MSGLRHDRMPLNHGADGRGTLASPRRVSGGMVFEGRVARTGDHEYPERNTVERRDASELRKIVAQLADIPVTFEHPYGGFLADSPNARVVGRVLRGWLDGNHAAAEILIEDEATIAAIEDGTKELSLGYAINVDGAGYHRDTELDHLAIVSVARCGNSCALRVDCGCESKGTTNMKKTELLKSLAAFGLRADQITGNGTPLSSRSDDYLAARLGILTDSVMEKHVPAPAERRDRADDYQHEGSARNDGAETDGQKAYAAFVEAQRKLWNNAPTVPTPRADGLTGAAAARADMLERAATGRENHLKTYGKKGA